MHAGTHSRVITIATRKSISRKLYGTVAYPRLISRQPAPGAPGNCQFQDQRSYILRMIYRRFIHRSRKRTWVSPAARMSGVCPSQRRFDLNPFLGVGRVVPGFPFSSHEISSRQYDRSRALELRFPSVATLPNNSGNAAIRHAKFFATAFWAGSKWTLERFGKRRRIGHFSAFSLLTLFLGTGSARKRHSAEVSARGGSVFSCKQAERRAHRPETHIGVSVNTSITSVCFPRSSS